MRAVESQERAHAEAQAIANAVLANPDAAALLDLPGESELTVTWDENGVPCKGRLDRLAQSGNGPLVIDLKTTRDLDEFDRAIGTYAIHAQTRHYQRGVEAASDTRGPRPLLIVVETSAPYRVQVFHTASSGGNSP